MNARKHPPTIHRFAVTLLVMGLYHAVVVADDAEASSRRHALIVIGLPGDETHAEQFEQTAQHYRDWLTTHADVKPDDVMILSGDSSTAESIRDVATQLSQNVLPGDSVWLFLLGHGSHDGRHGYLHLPGPDLNSSEWSTLLANLKAKEQVFWLMHSASGHFLKPFARPGRIVIAATDEGELNETHFPHLLAKTMQQDEFDSLLKLFQRTSERVDAHFETNEIAPTEHAQLDDNGDGIGTESPDLENAPDAETAAESDLTTVDGPRADGLPLTSAGVTTPGPDAPEDSSTEKTL